MVTLQIVKSLRFGELAVNSNSPNFGVVKLWRVSRNFMYTECCLFHMSNVIIEHTYNTFLGMIIDIKLRKDTFLLDDRALL